VKLGLTNKPENRKQRVPAFSLKVQSGNLSQILIQGGKKCGQTQSKREPYLDFPELLALAAMIVAFTPNTTLADEGVPIKGTLR